MFKTYGEGPLCTCHKVNICVFKKSCISKIKRNGHDLADCHPKNNLHQHSSLFHSSLLSSGYLFLTTAKGSLHVPFVIPLSMSSESGTILFFDGRLACIIIPWMIDLTPVLSNAGYLTCFQRRLSYYFKVRYYNLVEFCKMSRRGPGDWKERSVLWKVGTRESHA